MSREPISGGISSSPFARHVGEWKSDVESFFRDDWSRLRTLIVQLENQSWSNQLNLNVVSFSGFADAVDSRAAEPEQGILREDFIASGSASDGDSTSDRLLQLSVQIEQRLNVSSRQQE